MAHHHVQIEIGTLADLDLGSLRQCWLNLYGSEAPRQMSREIVIQAIAYRLQEQTFGGLSELSRHKLAKSQSPTLGPRMQVDRTIKSGTLFIREWQGRTVEVIADPNGGFVYRGDTYKSLSAIARMVTGVRWSGPAFFGLKQEKQHGIR